jgi:hypothetical protein
MTDIVERLQDARCDREPFTPEHAKCICRLTNEAAAEIERLREALGAIAGNNDLSAVADANADAQRSAAFAALHDCEIIAREALGD